MGIEKQKKFKIWLSFQFSFTIQMCIIQFILVQPSMHSIDKIMWLLVLDTLNFFFGTKLDLDANFELRYFLLIGVCVQLILFENIIHKTKASFAPPEKLFDVIIISKFQRYYCYRLFFLRSIAQFFTQIYMNWFVSS